jgi:four helix bundle protein
LTWKSKWAVDWKYNGDTGKEQMFIKVEDLRIYRQAEKISDDVWEIVIRWDVFAKRTVGEQLARAVDSVGANIAEGFGRHHFKDSIKFYYYARASLEETKFWIARSLSRGLIKNDRKIQLLESIESLAKQLNAFISKHSTVVPRSA